MQFVVAKGDGECLLCYETAQKLKIIRINEIKETKEPHVELSHEQIVAKFPELFSGKLGCLKGVCVKLDVDESIRPTRQPQRPVAFHLREAVEKELLEQINAGILEKVDQTSGPTPWVSNMVIIPKDKPVDEQGRPTTHKSVRITVDSKAVNKAIRRTRYPSKSIDDLVVQANGAVMFSVIDIMKAFHQIELHPESRYLTTITTHVGLLRYLRLHMGISCASEIFTEEIRKLLEDLSDCCLNMTDDILIYGRTEREHHEALMKVLHRLAGSGLTLRADKCKFYKTEVVFFGMRFSKDGIGPTEDRCRALREASEPENAKDLRSFLCTVLWSSRFVRDLCRLSEPLWRLLRAGVVWQWTEVERQAFKQVKESISTKCMAYFNKDWTTELEVDAGPEGLGAVLRQYNPDSPEMERAIVTFKSRLLTAYERKLSQVEKEALAAVWGPESNWIYLMGKPFVLVTDNRAVQLIFSNTAAKPPARIERLALRLSQFDFTVVHRPGTMNMADYYSRHASKQGPSAFLSELRKSNETELYVNLVAQSCIPRAVSMDMMKVETDGDQELQDLIGFIQSGKPVRDLPRSLGEYKRVFDDLSVTKSGLVMRSCRVVVPSGLRQRIMELAHVGHQGVVKTKALIRSRVWYPGIDAQVELMMKKCLACQANGEKQKLEPLRPSTMPAGPWWEVSADFYGPLDTGAYWMVNYCDYSRYVFVDSIKSVAMDHVQPVLERLFTMFGTPKVYKTDNGAPFMSLRFGQFADQWGFKHRKVTPLWPRANGGAESVMPKLGKVIKTCEVTGLSREAGLQAFLIAYRATPHSVTRVPPAMLFLGFCRTSGIPMVEPNRSFIESQHQRAVENDSRSKSLMTRNLNKYNKARECQLELGDQVLFRWARTRKSMPMWDPEPYEIVERTGSMITAARSDHSVTRNSSFFKLWDAVGSDLKKDEAEVVEESSGTALQEVDQPVVDQDLENGKCLEKEANLEGAGRVVEDRIRPGEGQLVAEPMQDEQAVSSGRGELATAVTKAKPGRPTKAQAAERKLKADEEARVRDLSRAVRRSERKKK